MSNLQCFIRLLINLSKATLNVGFTNPCLNVLGGGGGGGGFENIQCLTDRKNDRMIKK